MPVVDIRDIAPGKGEVTIGESAVEIRGLSMKAFAGVISRFPEILGFLSGGRVDDPLELLATLPDAAVVIMALGVGKGDDAEVMIALAGWELPQQATLFNAVIGRMLEGPGGPFVAMLLAAAARGAKAESGSPTPAQQEISAPISPNSPTS